MYTLTSRKVDTNLPYPPEGLTWVNPPIPFALQPRDTLRKSRIFCMDINENVFLVSLWVENQC